MSIMFNHNLNKQSRCTKNGKYIYNNNQSINQLINDTIHKRFITVCWKRRRWK